MKRPRGGGKFPLTLEGVIFVLHIGGIVILSIGLFLLSLNLPSSFSREPWIMLPVLFCLQLPLTLLLVHILFLLIK